MPDKRAGFSTHCRKQKAMSAWGINQGRPNLYQGFGIAFKDHLGYYPARHQMHGAEYAEKWHWKVLPGANAGRSFLRAPPPPHPPRLMNCAGAECQSWTVSTFTADTSHPIPSANTGEWTAGESDAVNAMRRWTRRVHAKINFFRNTYIFAFGLSGRLLEDGLHSLANAAPCAERQGTGTLRQHRLHCHVGKTYGRLMSSHDARKLLLFETLWQ